MFNIDRQCKHGPEGFKSSLPVIFTVPDKRLDWWNPSKIYSVYVYVFNCTMDGREMQV